MYVLYDSVTLDQIPASAPAVAGYLAGSWPTFGQLKGRFPHAKRLAIAIHADEDGDVLDCEPGDATPDQVVGWVQRAQRRGVVRPGVYTSVSSMQEIVNLLSQAGIKREAVRLWSAHYTYSPHLCGPKCGYGLASVMDATQWTDKALGRNLDESLVAADFFTVPPPPDPHQYHRFYDERFTWHGVTLPNERSLVKLYDKLRVHGIINRRKLKPVRVSLALDAERIALIVLSEPKVNRHYNWAACDRGWRYQQTLHRSQGKRFV